MCEGGVKTNYCSHVLPIGVGRDHFVIVCGWMSHGSHLNGK